MIVRSIVIRETIVCTKSKRRRKDGERKPNTDTGTKNGEARTSSCLRLCSATLGSSAHVNNRSFSFRTQSADNKLMFKGFIQESAGCNARSLVGKCSLEADIETVLISEPAYGPKAAQGTIHTLQNAVEFIHRSHGAPHSHNRNA